MKTRQDAICRTVKVRTFTNMQSYVEVEFTHKQESYWGVQFSANGSVTAPAAASQPVAPVASVPVSIPVPAAPTASAPVEKPAVFQAPQPVVPPQKPAVATPPTAAPLQAAPPVVSQVTAPVVPVAPSAPVRLRSKPRGFPRPAWSMQAWSRSRPSFSSMDPAQFLIGQSCGAAIP